MTVILIACALLFAAYIYAEFWLWRLRRRMRDVSAPARLRLLRMKAQRVARCSAEHEGNKAALQAAWRDLWRTLRS